MAVELGEAVKLLVDPIHANLFGLVVVLPERDLPVDRPPPDPLPILSVARIKRGGSRFRRRHRRRRRQPGGKGAARARITLRENEGGEGNYFSSLFWKLKQGGGEKKGLNKLDYIRTRSLQRRWRKELVAFQR